MLHYKIIRSKRKTLWLEVALDGSLTVRAPLLYSDREIAQFIEQHKTWVEKTQKKQAKRFENRLPPLTDSEIVKLKVLAKEILPKRIEYYSKLTGLVATDVKITSAKKRFGSCNGKNSICFSYVLMRYPDEAIDYVVLHELAHTKHHDHSRCFWALVERYMPDYKSRRKLLKG